ncbi:MAG: von Willebrand factor type A domain protein [Verrucomicrobia bacterium ADurb.Bin345]|nr:MAG: von Willebrand factor type A domain protein [Verrucomicrobia bacterium ADurb.Bin345]
MMLHHPIVLLLLLLVPGMVYLRYGRRRQPALGFSDGKVLARLTPGWAVVAQPLLPILYALGISLLIVALARPRSGLAESRVDTEGVDIILLADVSTSMRAEDFATPIKRMNRLDAAREVMKQFIAAREYDRIGLIAFAALPYTMSPLTLDHAWLLQQVDRLETGMVEDGTAIGDAIASAVNRLRDSVAKTKLVILLTDGVNNRGQLSPDNAAQAAKAMNVKVYTVGAGTRGLAPYPVMDPFGGRRYVQQPADIDEPSLRKIAEVTGAAYFRAEDMKTLQDVYRQIDEMEKTVMTVDQYTRFEERFMPWVILGLICLGVEKLLSLTRLGRLP